MSDINAQTLAALLFATVATPATILYVLTHWRGWMYRIAQWRRNRVLRSLRVLNKQINKHNPGAFMTRTYYGADFK